MEKNKFKRDPETCGRTAENQAFVLPEMQKERKQKLIQRKYLKTLWL